MLKKHTHTHTHISSGDSKILSWRVNKKHKLYQKKKTIKMLQLPSSYFEIVAG